MVGTQQMVTMVTPPYHTLVYHPPFHLLWKVVTISTLCNRCKSRSLERWSSWVKVTQLVNRGVEIFFSESDPRALSSHVLYWWLWSGRTNDKDSIVFVEGRQILLAVGNWRLVSVPLAFPMCLSPHKWRADVNIASSHSLVGRELTWLCSLQN